MNQVIEVNNVALGIKEYQGQRVITLKDIDCVHGRPSGTAKKNFQNNRKHFVIGVDYFKTTRKELKDIYSPNSKSLIGNPNLTSYLFTESGYLMLAKSLTDDLAWDVQRQLMEGYFKYKEISTENIALDRLADALTSITDRLSKLEELQQNQNDTHLLSPQYKKPYNPWFAKMQPKYKLLEDYFMVTRGQLFKNILKELENLYVLDTQQIQADYCYENNIGSCYPLEPYEFNPKYRDMVEQIVNSNLVKHGIASEDDPITSTKHITIFDTPTEK